ncbi:MAG TPA: DinB family protein [Vicinamibacterales bacterium]|nr:DinB family protein [Vicinamibacterales bacterium]
MTDPSRAFLDKSRSLLMFDYVPTIEQCLDRLSVDDIWWRPNESSNSIGNLILHLCGNVQMWIIGGVGNLPFERNRQMEFDERQHIPADELRRRLTRVVEHADAVISAVGAEDLLSRRQIQGYDVTLLEAIYHVVEHFSMHTGQIIVLSKARVAQDLKLWEPPSV